MSTRRRYLWAGLASVALACHAQDAPQLEAADVAGDASSPPETTAKAQANANGSDARPVPEPEPEPEPVPEPAPEPPGPEAFEAWLAQGDAVLHELGANRKPSTKARGKLPSPELELAYAQGRAQAYYGEPQRVQRWFVQAKFGAYPKDAKPSRLQFAADARGPLAGYSMDLVLHDKTRAYLHLWLPAEGLDPQGVGIHQTWVKEEAWRCLCDAPGRGKTRVLFKTNGRESPHRQWGRAWVVDELVSLAQDYAKRTGKPLGIGDLSLALGGKISDHWTHRRGVDADVYLLDFPEQTADALGAPGHTWHSNRKGLSRWATDEDGRKTVERDEEDKLSPTSLRLQALAEAALPLDRLWFFVHDAVTLLEPFDQRAQAQRPGRRYLHAKNRAFWPAHRDHAHLRWSDRPLPVGKPPKP